MAKIGKTVNSFKGLIQKIGDVKLSNINILLPPDTHTYLCVSGDYSMLMFKSFTLRYFWMIPKDKRLDKYFGLKLENNKNFPRYGTWTGNQSPTGSLI